MRLDMKKLGLLTILLVCISGCSTLQVGTEAVPDIDYSRLSTYNWLNDQDSPGSDIRVNNEMVVNSVRNSVEKALKLKGYQKADRNSADILVVWFGAIEKKLNSENIDHFYRRNGYGALYRDPRLNPDTTISSTEYEEGRLIIDILDQKTHTVIWRGEGTRKIIKGRTESQVRKNLEDTVKKILAGFPPD